MNSNKHLRNGITSRAFTLIELLTVIAIIGVLAAIIIPTVIGVRVSARRTTCANNLRQLGIVFQIYTDDSRDRFPGKGTSATTRWIHKLAPYINVPTARAYNQSLYHCSLTSTDVYAQGAPNPGWGLYGLSEGIFLPDVNGTPAEYGVRRSDVNNPSRKVLLAEKNHKGGAGNGPGLSRQGPFPTRNDGAAANHRMDQKPENGPGGACNYLFVDGHVKSLKTWPGVDAFDVSK